MAAAQMTGGYGQLRGQSQPSPPSSSKGPARVSLQGEIHPPDEGGGQQAALSGQQGMMGAQRGMMGQQGMLGQQGQQGMMGQGLQAARAKMGRDRGMAEALSQSQAGGLFGGRAQARMAQGGQGGQGMAQANAGKSVVQDDQFRAALAEISRRKQAGGGGMMPLGALI